MIFWVLLEERQERNIRYWTIFASIVFPSDTFDLGGPLVHPNILEGEPGNVYVKCLMSSK